MRYDPADDKLPDNINPTAGRFYRQQITANNPLGVIPGYCEICANQGIVTLDEYINYTYNAEDRLTPCHSTDDHSEGVSTWTADINRPDEGEFFFVGADYRGDVSTHPVARLAAFHAAHRAIGVSKSYEINGTLQNAVRLRWKDVGPGFRAVSAEVETRRKQR